MTSARAMLATTRAAVARGRVFGTTCLAHLVHDGCGEMLYLLLPLWQREFGLTLTEVGLLKTCYSAALAGGQIPASRLGERWGERLPLVAGTLLTALAVLAFHAAGGLLPLAFLLVLSGLGASVQHPLASTLILRRHAGPSLRMMLGTYNFTGDVGKVAISALATLLIWQFSWRAATQTVGLICLATAAVLFVALGTTRADPAQHDQPAAARPSQLPQSVRRRGFVVLSAIGFLDSTARTGFLTFMPFVLLAKGAGPAELGIALSLVFGGGAVGKFVCGAFGARIGLLRTVVLTEVGTVLGILLLLVLPLSFCIALMPLIGVALNGTSSILYGTVPDVAPPGREARAFGVFYTLTIGAGAVAPTFYGAVGDVLGLNGSMILIAAVLLLVLPLVSALRPAIHHHQLH